MSNRLEQFIRDHREEFDGEEPGKRVWEDIRFRMEPTQPSVHSLPGQETSGEGKYGTSKIVRFTSVRWSAAAAIILVIAGSIWFFKHNGQQTAFPAIAGAQPASPAAAKSQQPSTDTPSGITPRTEPPGADQAATAQTATGSSETAGTPEKGSSAATEADATINEEMYHYARLVELKHKELKTIEKDEPLLYRQFAADVHALDSVYQSLQQQLPKNPNREQLLEAMLQNLQLQMGLLNHQLDIIKQINHSKKT
ncbi:MAG TPA: hypothetical protein VL832_07570, partial [Puia sp.]|nr:hypothetical protein [Puia sp.]